MCNILSLLRLGFCVSMKRTITRGKIITAPLPRCIWKLLRTKQVANEKISCGYRHDMVWFCSPNISFFSLSCKIQQKHIYKDVSIFPMCFIMCQEENWLKNYLLFWVFFLPLYIMDKRFLISSIFMHADIITNTSPRSCKNNNFHSIFLDNFVGFHWSHQFLNICLFEGQSNKERGRTYV